jgi:hypothetical protein
MYNATLRQVWRTGVIELLVSEMYPCAINDIFLRHERSAVLLFTSGELGQVVC